MDDNERPLLSDEDIKRYRDGKYLDELCRKVVSEDVNRAVPWFMYAGWAYENDFPWLLSEDCWGWLCEVLFIEWDEITHPHKNLIDVIELCERSAESTRFPLAAVQRARRALAQLFPDIAFVVSFSSVDDRLPAFYRPPRYAVDGD